MHDEVQYRKYMFLIKKGYIFKNNTVRKFYKSHISAKEKKEITNSNKDRLTKKCKS